MEMHQVRYFLAVCETLNFTRAAEMCNVAQPALTRAIQKLEEELGGQLFRRERHRTHLSDLGRLMRPHLAEMMSETDRAKAMARSFLKLESAALQLGVMCTIGPVRFVTFLSEFRASHPGVELTLVESVPDRLGQLLLEGRIDVAIMAQPTTFDERLDVFELYRERFVLGFPVGHRFAERNALRAGDIDGENYLLRVNCEFKDHIAEIRAGQGARANRVYSSEREDWIQTMVAAGLGICFMPEFSVTGAGVLTRPVVDPEIVRVVSLVTVSGRRFSPALAGFVKATKAYRWSR